LPGVYAKAPLSLSAVFLFPGAIFFDLVPSVTVASIVGTLLWLDGSTLVEQEERKKRPVGVVALENIQLLFLLSAAIATPYCPKIIGIKEDLPLTIITTPP
jgi:hypothetical protein